MTAGPALVILSPLPSTSDDCLAHGTTPVPVGKGGLVAEAPGSPIAARETGAVGREFREINRRTEVGASGVMKVWRELLGFLKK